MYRNHTQEHKQTHTHIVYNTKNTGSRRQQRATHTHLLSLPGDSSRCIHIFSGTRAHYPSVLLERDYVPLLLLLLLLLSLSSNVRQTFLSFFLLLARIRTLTNRNGFLAPPSALKSTVACEFLSIPPTNIDAYCNVASILSLPSVLPSIAKKASSAALELIVASAISFSYLHQQISQMEWRQRMKEALCVCVSKYWRKRDDDDDDDGMVGWWDGGMRGGKRKRVMEKRLHKER